jgi:hypothetical protein
MIRDIICRINRISFLTSLIMADSNNVKSNNKKFNNRLHNNQSKFNKTYKMTNFWKNISPKGFKAPESITITNLIISLTTKLKCWLIRNKQIKKLTQKTYKFKNLNVVTMLDKKDIIKYK